MKQSKLIEIIKKIEVAELNSLSQYINAVKSKKQNNSFLLFEIIKKEYPKFNSKNLEKKTIHQILFPAKKYDEKRMINLMFDLLKIIEEFISYSFQKKDKLENQYALLQFYLDNDFPKYFESTFKQTEDTIARMLEDAHVLAFKYKLEMIYIQYQLKYNNRYSNYQNAFNTLNDFSVSQYSKLNNLCHINLYNDIDTNQVNSCLANIHQSLHQLKIEDDIQKYDECKSKVFQSVNRISKDELRTVILILADYCIKKTNKKEDVFVTELLALYDFMIHEGIILESNDIISSAIVKNYVTISIRLNKMEEANYFIENFKHHIDIHERDDVYNFNKSNLLFYQSKLEESLLLLNKSKYKDVFYKISSRRLYIKIYFELSKQNQKQYFNVLDSSLNAFKKYIYTSQDFSDTVRHRNKSFYKYVNKLVNMYNSDKAKLSALLNEVIKDVDCSDREWILSKISEL